jgi:hypothetical protein
VIREVEGDTVDLNAVVRHYKQKFRERAEQELGTFHAEKTLEDAIRRAALAEDPGGKRYAHQWRREREDLERSAAKLATRAAEIASASDFASLFQIVRSAVHHLRGIGELYIYDTALRIGAKKNALPKLVYLHAGTRKGAKALGIDVEDVPALFKFELPQELRELEAHEIEDVLCIYKRYFTGECPELDDNDICWLDEVDED